MLIARQFGIDYLRTRMPKALGLARTNLVLLNIRQAHATTL